MIRIYPLYFFVLTFFVIALGRPKTMVPQGLRELIVAYSMSQAFFPSLVLIGTTVGWFLTLECFFYFLAPWIIRWLERNGSISRIVLKALFLGIVFSSCGVLIGRLPLTNILIDTIFGAQDSFILHYTIFGHMPDFLAGIVGGMVFIRRDLLNLNRFGMKIIWIGLIGVFASIVLLDLAETSLGSPLYRILGFCVALFSSVFALGLVYDRTGNHIISKCLGSRIMVYLGSISFSLFLIQLTEPCQWLYWILLGEKLGIENRFIRAGFLYLLSSILAAILYEMIERPSHRFFLSLLNRHFKPKERVLN